jgi:hypothetical protein
MPKDGCVTIGRGWKPPATFDPTKCFKLKSSLRHISRVEEPDGTYRHMVRLHLNERLTDKEKIAFRNLMRDRHLEWFSCACWGSNGNKLTVRISIKNNEHLVYMRTEVGKHADLVLQ